MMPNASQSGPDTKSDVPEYLRPGKIGSLTLANRLIRTATSETMATEQGGVTNGLINFYGALARGGAGLLITGHAYVEEVGQCSARQIGIYSDTLVPGLARLTAAVHQNGGRIFCELSHAGSQSVMPNIDPIAPSIIENAIFERQPREMSAADIERIVAAFGQAAHRAAAAGFDGIHIHGGNGYLISQFNSPFSNRRSDQWGGDADRRSRFILAVYDAIRAAVGPDMPITARYGLADSGPGQLQIDEGLARLRVLAARGLNAVEPTYGLMTTYHENIRPYVAVTPARALQDWVLPRLWQPAQPEAYYLPFAKAVKAALDIPVILVGGVRSTGRMTRILCAGDADFLAAARPFIREPDFPQSLKAGRQGLLDCVFVQHLPGARRNRCAQVLAKERKRSRRACLPPFSGKRDEVVNEDAEGGGRGATEMHDSRRLIVGISGASGIIYGVRALQLLRGLGITTHLVMSKSAEVTLA